MLASLLLCAVSLATSATDIGFEKLFIDSAEPVDECFPYLPAQSALNGSFIITSGGLFGMGDTKLVAIFDSWGKMHKFDFNPDSGKVCYKAKMMETGFYNESKKLNTVAHGILFVESDPPRKKCVAPMCNLMAANDNTFVNNMEIAPGKFCSLTDTSTWQDFNAETLGDFHKHKFNDHIKKPAHMAQMGPAHPQLRPNYPNTWVSVEQQSPLLPGGKPIVTVFTLDTAKPDMRFEVASYEYANLPYFHSFGLHEDFALLIHQPVWVDISQLEKTGLLGPAFTDLPDTNTKFKVVPFNGGDIVTYNSSEHFYHLHTVNTHTVVGANGNTQIVVDAEVYEGFPYTDPSMTIPGIKNKTARDACRAGCFGMIKRYSIDTVTGVVAKGVPSRPPTPRLRSL